MDQCAVILCLALMAIVAAQPPYKYPLPQNQGPLAPPVAKPAFGVSGSSGGYRPQAPTNNGIYSAVQSPPLPSFNVNGGSGSFAQQPIKQSYAAQLSEPFLPSPPLSGPLPPAPAPQFNYAQSQVFGSQASLPQAAGAPVPQQSTIITKDIYIHSAPEEYEEIGGEQPLDNLPIRKNYRIVFIKAPIQNLKYTATALKRAQASNEEKTVIYVLSKKPDLTEVQQQLQLVQNEQKTHKPEVYFIKYKTPEEAQRAQQEIQAQYDALGGSTHVSDEGIAPVTSVVGGGPVNLGFNGNGGIGGNVASGALNLGAATGNGFVGGNSLSQQQTFFSQNSASSFGGAPGQKYLPAKVFKK